MSKYLCYLTVFYYSCFHLLAAEFTPREQPSLMNIEANSEEENFYEEIGYALLPSFKIFYESCKYDPDLLLIKYAELPPLHELCSRLGLYENVVRPQASKSVQKAKKDLKRKRDDDDNNLNNKKRLLKLKKNVPCKSPIMLALLHGVDKKQGGTFKNRDEGIIEITDLDTLLEYIKKNIKKAQATKDKEYRVKAISKWFSNFPEKDQWYNNTYELKILETKMKSYRRLFS